jgi:formiminotetrahydrofolate cyclodeaminase
MDAYKLPKDSAERAPTIQRAMHEAAEVPMRVAELSARVRQLASAAMDKGLKTAKSDATVSIYMAEAAIKGAVLNVQENLGLMTDEKVVGEYRERIGRLEIRD